MTSSGNKSRLNTRQHRSRHTPTPTLSHRNSLSNAPTMYIIVLCPICHAQFANRESMRVHFHLTHMFAPLSQ
ncbi:hypothetical protein GGI05_003466 [Coemansia sp. RSA 2603]|nr:hypothetical protein GGI05_003466 [Coemansia sp. RSA 2603]